jgi:hypothetical protein
MDISLYIHQLESHSRVFESLVTSIPQATHRWKPGAESWSVTETVGHLLYEERHDFRARIRVLLSGSAERFAPINPTGVVVEERYNEGDAQAFLRQFLDERRDSLTWLHGLKSPDWNAAYTHPPLEGIHAGDFLVAWAAHDVLHLRQLVELKWGWLQTQLGGYDSRYAGEW